MRLLSCPLVLPFALVLACNGGGRGSESDSGSDGTTAGIASFGTGTGTAGETDSSTAAPTTGPVDPGETTVAPTTGPVDPGTTTSSETTGPVDPSTTSTTAPETSTGTTTDDPPPRECSTTLTATIRDFRVDHPDFENFGGDTAYTGLVQVDLGPDQKPVYAHPGPTPQTTGPAEFAQWYNNTPDVNQAFEISIELTEVMPGKYTYQNNNFFPIDNQGWGNEGNSNNFHFTTEIHTEFTYQGGEVFTFTGDDDLWLFINGKLAIDLGGLHPELSDSIDLDANAAALGIQIGQNYAMDIFHAERHTNQSNFRIDTSIQCFVIPG